MTGYQILRGMDPDNLSTIATVDGDTTRYVDKEGLKEGETYYYSVRAENSIGPGTIPSPVQQKFPKEDEGTPGFSVLMTLLVISLVVVDRMWSTNRRGR